MSNQSKNEGLINFLASVLKKPENQVSPENTNDINLLSSSMIILSEEIRQIQETIELLTKAITNQNSAINDLYTVQEFLLKQIKASISNDLPSIKKPKNDDKPN